MFFCSAPRFTCLLFTNNPIRMWSQCVQKWFLFPGLLTVIRKRLQGKKFTSSFHSKHYIWLTGEFQKYQTKVGKFWPSFGWSNGRMLSASEGLRPPEPLTRGSLTRGSAPGPRWGLCPQTPVIGSHSALATSPTHAFCQPHSFRPGDAPV